ncbi:MAG: hypothetical protein AAF710_11280 [Planctomycetota bacterium]
MSATTPEVHAEPKTYLQDADVVSLRFDPEGPEGLPGRVAGLFVAALRAGDAETVSKLLSPKLGLAGDAEVSRLTLAETLAGRDWSGLDEAPTATDDPLAWDVARGGQRYRLALVPGDGLFYVAGLTESP